jgi:chromosome partitioning protein
VAILDRLTTPFQNGAGRARNKQFLEAAMAAAALAAAAGGGVSLGKRHVLDQVLESIDALRAFDVHEAVDLFMGHAQALREAPEDARVKAIRAISPLAGNAEAGLIVRVAAAVARADGNIAEAAKAEVERIAAALGVPAPSLAGAGLLDGAEASARAPVIAVGNEKGGTGKSTTAVHLIVGLLHQGHTVGSIDLDGRQGTLSRYFDNRERFAGRAERTLVMPVHRRIAESNARDRGEAEDEERARLESAFADMTECDFVVIDTPGSNTHLSRLGHAHADTLVTPLNDSFLDIDVLARVDRERREVLEPSAYCEMVWAQNERREAAGREPADWIVMRNRLAHIDARNTREMAGLLDQLSERMKFRLQPGFSERVVYRELFYRGLTLLDLDDDPVASSHHRARQEVEDLLGGLGVAGLAEKPEPAARAAP